jgi:outer membrane protein insertion porin family
MTTRQPTRLHVRWLLPLLLMPFFALQLDAQDSIYSVSASAQVGSIDFRFTHTESFSANELGRVLALKGRGTLYGARRVLGELPVVPSPGIHKFDPVELQKDVVRLRRFYQRSGFPAPVIDYQLRSNDEGTVVGVTFLIEEGTPVVLRELWMATRAGAGAMEMPDSLRAAWRKLETELAKGRGLRFGDAEAMELETRTRAWLQDRGYQFAKENTKRQVDSNAVDVTLQIEPGSRRKVDEITVVGNSSVNDRVVLRALPFRRGDWYSASQIEEGRTQVQQIALFRQTSVETDTASQGGTGAAVRIEVREAKPRIALAEVGYISEGAGVTSQVQWRHPNFTGGARSLTASLEAQTGVGAIGDPQKLLRASLNLTQPYVATPKLSLIVGPFAEYRDDFQDLSRAIGLSSILLYRLPHLSSIALQYQLSARRIDEYRLGNAPSGSLSFAQLLSLRYPPVVDSLGKNEDKSTLALIGTFSRLDNLSNPRSGWTIRPQAEITAPSVLTTVEFARLDITTSGFVPMSRKVVLTARVSAGRLFPFGKSIPGPLDNPAYSLIRLRDELMTGGGTNDVRGWGGRQMGPKFPDVTADVESGDTVLTADNYTPFGGLAKVSGTVELRMPLPGMPSSWGTHVFLDAGRVWTPDDRFSLGAFQHDDDFRFSTGAGFSYLTPVGAIRLSLGVKLNPSELDLRTADDVLQALVEGRPVSSVPENDWRRLHLHLSFGVAM